MKHTQWHYREVNGKLSIWTDQGLPSIQFSKANTKHPKAWEDARLIATAPELLEACEGLIDDWHSDDANFNIEEPKHLKMARQAIKKARGEI